MPSFGHGIAPGKSTKFAVAASPRYIAAVGNGVATFDAKGSLNTGASTTAVSLSGTPITIGSGTSRAIAVFLAFGSAANLPTGITVTCGGVLMTPIVNASVNAPGGVNASGLWFGLINPASGTPTITANWTGGRSCVMQAVSFTGVDQTGGVTSFAHGTSNSNVTLVTTSSITIASAVGNITVAAFILDGATVNSTSATQDSIVTPSSGGITSAQNHTAGTASNVMTATYAASDATINTGFDLVASTASSNVTANLSIIEVDDTLGAIVNLSIQTNLLIIETADTLSSAGILLIQSNLNVTEETDILNANATTINAVNADLSIIEASDILVAIVVLPTQANLSVTEAIDSLSASTTLQVKSNLTITEGNDSLAGNASVGILSNLAAIEVNDVLSANSNLLIQSNSTVNESDDALLAVATTIGAISANLSIVEVADILAAIAIATIKSDMSSVEANDDIVAGSILFIKSDASIAEGNDSLVCTSKVSVATILNVIENGDILASTVSTNISGNINADLNMIESNDVLYSNAIKIPCFYMGGSSSASSKSKTKTKQELSRLVNIERSKIRVTYHR